MGIYLTKLSRASDAAGSATPLCGDAAAHVNPSPRLKLNLHTSKINAFDV